MSETGSPLLDAVALLARARIDFIVVGVMGINFYARDASESVVTADVDVFLPRRVEVLRSALRCLHDAGFRFSSGGEHVVRFGANLVAENEAGAQVDLMLSGGGFDFDDLASDALTFQLGEIEVRVGRLDELLRSKELAGRPKDVAFLTMFAARLRAEAGED